MRKLICLVAILFLMAVVVPVQAQDDSLPIPVILTATIEGGCVLSISPDAVTFIAGMMKPLNGWIDQNEAPLVGFLSFKLGESVQLDLKQFWVTDFVHSNGSEVNIGSRVKQVFTGEISTVKSLATEGVGSVSIQRWTTSETLDFAVAFQLQNVSEFEVGSYVAEIYYQARAELM